MGVATWFFLPPELSRLCDVHNPICSIKLNYRTGHCSVPRTKWQPTQYLSKSTALHTDLRHNKVAQWSGKLEEQHKMAWLFTGGRNEKQKPISPRAIMHLSLSSRYSCNLSHSYLIPQEFPGQTNVLLISSLLLLKRGRAMKGRELDYSEWEQEVERREEEGRWWMKSNG